MAFGLGGGANKTSSSSNSQSTAQSFGSNVWGPQQQYLQSMWGAGQGLANGPIGGQPGLDAANQNAGYAQQGLLQSNQNLQQFMQPQVDPAFQMYSDRVGQQYNQQFLPGMKGQAIQAGGLGGSRQQIGNALGAQAGMQSISDFGAQSYAGQQQRALQAAGQQGQNSQMLGALGQQNLMNADFSRGMPWYNQQMFAGLLGGPVMQDLGSYAQSTSTSKSKGKGWNADISGGASGGGV
jgi:hypothetical protein